MTKFKRKVEYHINIHKFAGSLFHRWWVYCHFNQRKLKERGKLYIEWRQELREASFAYLSFTLDLQQYLTM